MRCAACGTENRPGARFCNGCGAALAARCSACGQSNPPGSRFCDACGQALTAPTPTVEPTPGPTPATPQDYTPRHLADKILAGRDALRGERKQITVLFADVVGSTELVRDRDPEEAQRLLDDAVQQMMTAVHRYEGTVSRLQGDGLMAMFGAPVAHEDHAVRACYAALAMLEGVREYAEAARTRHGAAIQIRVGLNSGEVIVRLISDDLHMDYTAMGQTVHLASRMEGLANAGTVLLSPSTLALAEGLIDARPLGPTTVKGLEQPVEVFELVGAGTARTRLQAAAARGLTPFVGRQEELAAIERALARARAGQGQVVALVAEPGVGKSRLVWEATRSNQASGFAVLQTGAVSYGQATAWLPEIDLLRTYFQIESRDDHAAMRAKVTGGMQALDSALASDLPALLSLLDVPVDPSASSGQAAAWTALDPARRRAATLDALRRLLLCEGQRQPLLLVFEDLHWIDAETQALLDGLVEVLPTARIVLLVNYRPEYSHTWGNKSYYTQLRVDPLGKASADEMLDSLLGHDPTVLLLKELLVSRTEGNPFFLEESVRTLVETGALVGERGAYRLAHAVADIRVPATVQAMLAARIDRLPPDEKRLLQTAAVIGKDVPFTLLEAITDTPDAELRSGLSRLQAAELLYPVRLFPEPEYTFKHALTHGVAYGSLLQERRKSVHGQIVDAIKHLHSNRLDEHVERLAYHALRAEDWPRAVGYARMAGQRAAGRSAYRDARAWFEGALRSLHHLASDRTLGDHAQRERETRELEVDIRLDLRDALAPLGADREALAHLEAAEPIATALGDQRRLGRIASVAANTLRQLGAYDAAIVAGQRALDIAVAIDDPALYAVTTNRLAILYMERCDYRRAVDALRPIIGAAGATSDARRSGLTSGQVIVAYTNIGRTLSILGEFDEALGYAAEAVRLAEAHDDPFQLATACNILGGIYHHRGQTEPAVRLGECATEIARAGAFLNALAWATANLAEAHALAGQTTEGISLLEGLMELSRSSGRLQGQAIWAVWLGEAYLAAGRVPDARTTVEDGLALAVTQRERGNQALALHVLGKIATSGATPDVEAAEQRYREALTLAEELEMRPLQAHCHLGLGKLYRRVGRLEEARAELSTAVGMLHEMGMTYWLPEAEAERAKVDDSEPADR